MRNLNGIYAGVAESDQFGVATDVVLVAVVVLLIAELGRTAGALKATHDAAALRQEEYDRALKDYRRLARHRLANPLTAIRGSIATLRELPDLDDETRARLLEAMADEASRLEHIALDPEVLGEEERGLDPQPRL